jgi:hypothetical protein
VEAERLARTAEKSGRGGSLIKELKLLGNASSKTPSAQLLSSTRTPLVTDEDKLKRWREHFSSVVNCSPSVCQTTLESLPTVSPPVGLPPSPSSSEVDPLCAPLSEEEISIALFQTKSGKAPGPDGISAEVLKLGGSASVRGLKAISDQVWKEEAVPSDWQKQLIVPLHKKGSWTECDNYRGIALLSTPSKILCRAILNRLKPLVESLLREGQFGFRRGHGCTDHLFSLRVMMEKAREFRYPLYMCFVDLRKAYDSVNREALSKVLQVSFNLPTKLISIIRTFHKNSTAAVRAYGKRSAEFDVTSGVRQGCVLAPTLFNLYFDLIIST